MMKSEFIERTGFEPTAAEYEVIEQEYMGCDIDKDRFCKDWKKNGGIQRLCRMRARRIEELEAEVTKKNREYDEMDARHSRRFNQMNDLWKQKVSQLEEKLRDSAEDNDNLSRMFHEAVTSREEAEEKLETVRKAFEILGIAKEVA